MSQVLPAVYLAAGEGRRLRPLTDDRQKAMLEIGDRPLAERALTSIRAAGVSEVVAVTGHCAEPLLAGLGELVTGDRFNPHYARHNNVYSLWCARDVVAGGCYVINSDVLFEDEVARRLVAADGSTVLCSTSHGVDAESMKAVFEGGRLAALSKDASNLHPEYIGLARIDPAHGPLLVRILDVFVQGGVLDVYYESAIEELGRRERVSATTVDGLAWIEIDDHDDLARAREDVLARVL